MSPVSSHSAQVTRTRPLYARHAQAYDLLVTDPVEPWVEAVHERLARAGRPAAAVLDAGCGTGRHAAALTALGHHVDLADAAEDLLRQAAARCPRARTFQVDLCALDLKPQYQAVTCRGVLNDMLADTDRAAALRCFATSLRTGGVLFLDVREERGSRERADATPRRRTVQLAPDTQLDFTSTVLWHAGLLHVEQYALRTGPRPVQESTYDFVMRAWTQDELACRLSAAGFHDIEIRPGVGRKTPDRLLVIARVLSPSCAAASRGSAASSSSTQAVTRGSTCVLAGPGSAGVCARRAGWARFRGQPTGRGSRAVASS
jgi:SAM-dependent methyltransferase